MSVLKSCILLRANLNLTVQTGSELNFHLRNINFGSKNEREAFKVMRALIAFLSAASFLAISARGQSTFQNLDFESAQVLFNDPPSNYHIDATNALPGWEAFSGTTQLDSIPYDVGSTFPPVILYSKGGGGSLEGYFSVVLSGAGSAAGFISQTALVPVDARSLHFIIGTSYYGPFSVSLQGQDLSYTALSVTATNTLYGADVSSFQGETATLGFKSLGGITLLDDIQFSSQPIPEPLSIALLSLSGLFFAVRRLRKRLR